MGFRTRYFIPAVVVGFLATPASAHDWYPAECCAGRDCRPADPGEVVVEKDGVRIVPTGETIPWSRVRPSPDGRVHRCSARGKVDGRTICVFLGVTS